MTQHNENQFYGQKHPSCTGLLGILTLKKMSENQTSQYKVSFQRSGRNFDLLDSGGAIITSLRQEDSRYSVALFNGLPFEIISTDFWGRKFDISDDGQNIGKMGLKFWQEKLVIEMLENNEAYVLKSHGFWSPGFVLEDQNGDEVLSLKEESSRGKVAYVVEIINSKKIDIEIEKFLVICGYATDVIMSHRSSDLST